MAGGPDKPRGTDAVIAPDDRAARLDGITRVVLPVEHNGVEHVNVYLIADGRGGLARKRARRSGIHDRRHIPGDHHARPHRSLQVASELFVSVRTVQFHLIHIYAKVGVSSRAELATRLREDTPADVATATRGPRDCGGRSWSGRARASGHRDGGW
jgi:hypothetical protein